METSEPPAPAEKVEIKSQRDSATVMNIKMDAVRDLAVDNRIIIQDLLERLDITIKRVVILEQMLQPKKE